MTMHDSDHFDLAMRTRWQLAARHLPAQVTWKLRPATHTPAAPRRSAWPIVTAFAMLAMFGFGIHLLLPRLQPQTASPADAMAQSATHAPVNAGVTDTALEETPDFYAWLGSNEADLVAMEVP